MGGCDCTYSEARLGKVSAPKFLRGLEPIDEMIMWRACHVDEVGYPRLA